MTGILLGSPLATAQIVGGDWPLEQSLFGTAGGDRFGTVVDCDHDFDLDGVLDILVSSPMATINGASDTGSVAIFSGADGHLILRLDGQTAGALFGIAADTLGDVNGDAVPEILVGAPLEAPGGLKDAGSAFLFSGADGSLLWRVDGAKTIDKMGSAVARVGDIDGDGVDDAALGAHSAYVGSTYHAGLAVAVSGATGAVLYTFPGFHLHSHFGYSVAGPGDLNGDGVPDIAVGGYGVETTSKNNTGAVIAYSGADGSQIWRYDGQRAEAHRGEALAPAGDFDGDGVPDLLDGSQRSVGKPYARYAGAVLVHSGVDGSPLYEIRGSDPFQGLGAAVAPAGDIDGDGLDDFLVGSPGSDPKGQLDAGEVLVLAGGSGALLHRFVGTGYLDNLGRGVAGGRDLDGDGRLDLLLGIPGRAISGNLDVGRVDRIGWNPILDTTAAAVSGSVGGTVDFLLDFPAADGGQAYGLLFSSSGTGPTPVGGIEVPLTRDGMFFHSTLGHYPPYLSGGSGVLDAAGDAVATLAAGPGDLAKFVGLDIWCCAVSDAPGSGLARSSVARRFIVTP
ncbi:MAG: hypothetical protein D6702_08430 [Planctomycetota bacterium]|nr:MAG: hypothetical protein D6702_08430 [Planctomycetota bacterium]